VGWEKEGASGWARGIDPEGKRSWVWENEMFQQGKREGDVGIVREGERGGSGKKNKAGENRQKTRSGGGVNTNTSQEITRSLYHSQSAGPKGEGSKKECQATRQALIRGEQPKGCRGHKGGDAGKKTLFPS